MVNDDATGVTVTAANRAIMAGTDVSADVIDDSEMAVTALENELADIEDAHRMAMSDAQKKTAADNAALGKAMRAALGGNPLANIEPTDGVNITSGDLAINAAADGVSDPVTLEAGTSAGSLGGWNGMNYARTDDGKVTDMARVYTNREAETKQAFSKKYDTELGDGDSITVDNTGGSLVMASAFMHSGIQTHVKPDRSDAVYVRGTYDGAPGEYSCVAAGPTTPCSSTGDGTGTPSALVGTWMFKPDAGAMVSQPDPSYLYYGWWVSKDGAGDPMKATAFAGVFGDDGGDQAPLTGSAKYVGHAAGKFAMSNTLDGTDNGGHFTADAELIAKFGAISSTNTNGVTGTIDNFRLNDGSENPGWSVSLNRSSDWGNDGAITGPTDEATTWSINGIKASPAGSWKGTMYDEAPGDAPDGDGSNVPTTVTGTFNSDYSDIGRMVGAFGANKE